MFKYPKSLDNLINSFSMLPGVGKKTAERFAFYVANNLNKETIEEFIYNLESVKNGLHQCPICGVLTDDEHCQICQDNDRNKEVILVVEDVRDVFIIESLEEYKGMYHVLNGTIKFSKGIGIEDLNIDSLIERLEKGNVKEVILGCNATLEGETTARYLKEILSKYDIKISRIAYGLPVGGDLAYADQMTLLKALEGRNEYK